MEERLFREQKSRKSGKGEARRKMSSIGSYHHLQGCREDGKGEWKQLRSCRPPWGAGHTWEVGGEGGAATARLLPLADSPAPPKRRASGKGTTTGCKHQSSRHGILATKVCLVVSIERWGSVCCGVSP